MSDNLTNKQVEQMINEMQSIQREDKYFATYEEVVDKMHKFDKTITQEERKLFETLSNKVYCCVTKIGVYHPQVYESLIKEYFFGYTIDDYFKPEAESHIAAEKFKNIITFGSYNKKAKEKIVAWAVSCPTLIKALAYSAKLYRGGWTKYYATTLKTIIQLEKRSVEEFDNVNYLYTGFVNVKRR